MHYSRENPSPRYRELMALYQRMHEEGIPEEGRRPEATFPGESLRPHLRRIKRLIQHTQARTLLDYGSGKGLQYQPMTLELEGTRWPGVQTYWGVEQIYCYDPGYPPLSVLPRWTFDGVICTDVLEHCPEEDIPWILEEIFSFARRFVYANIASFPAKKTLPNGENAHCTIRPAEWWLEQVRAIAPKVAFELIVTTKAVDEAGKPRYHSRVITNLSA